VRLIRLKKSRLGGILHTFVDMDLHKSYLQGATVDGKEKMLTIMKLNIHLIDTPVLFAHLTEGEALTTRDVMNCPLSCAQGSFAVPLVSPNQRTYAHVCSAPFYVLEETCQALVR